MRRTRTAGYAIVTPNLQSDVKLKT